MNLLTQEVALRLRKSPGTLKNWRVQGIGPKFKKFGRRVVYPLDELIAWENEQPLRSNTSYDT